MFRADASAEPEVAPQTDLIRAPHRSPPANELCVRQRECLLTSVPLCVCK